MVVRSSPALDSTGRLASRLGGLTGWSAGRLVGWPAGHLGSLWRAVAPRWRRRGAAVAPLWRRCGAWWRRCGAVVAPLWRAVAPLWRAVAPLVGWSVVGRLVGRFVCRLVSPGENWAREDFFSPAKNTYFWDFRIVKKS